MNSLETLWARQSAEFRDPHQVAGQWSDAGGIDEKLLDYEVEGPFFETLAALGRTLVVSREHEHLLVALGADAAGPKVSYFRIPHPSGIAYDDKSGNLVVASTRNPNQLVWFSPTSRLLFRDDAPSGEMKQPVWIPSRALFLPGCSYVHDLAFVGGTLHGNTTGRNCVVRLDDHGALPVWWPAFAEAGGKLLDRKNYFQLNSIAAGDSLAASFFTATTDRIETPCIGDPSYAVDGKGVLIDGRTREVVLRGLTRPHSARLIDGRVWIANSGYGEIGSVAGDKFEVRWKLDGWTRGMAHAEGHLAVGASRIIPRFAGYAPGLAVDRCRCAVHIFDLADDTPLATLWWPNGNQVFAVELIPNRVASGFPFPVHGADSGKAIFYAFDRHQGDADAEV